MSSTSPVVLIFGAGPRVGQHVARAFASKGYKIALVARKLNEKDNNADQINITGDLSDPNAVVGAFTKTKALLGIPSVVVYNASAGNFNEPESPLTSLSVADFTEGLHVNVLSPFIAAQQSVLGFEQLPESASRTFIYTGNILNTGVTMAPLLAGGMGKSAAAHMIQHSAAVYKDRGYKFYYGDERKADGSAAFKIDGDAHAKLYVELAEGSSQGPWQQTFVKGVGYKQFPEA